MVHTASSPVSPLFRRAKLAQRRVLGDVFDRISAAKPACALLSLLLLLLRLVPVVIFLLEGLA